MSTLSSLETTPKVIKLSSDGRTQVWKVICPVCGADFTPPTTMLSRQEIDCPKRKCLARLIADYNAEPPVVRPIG
jgi:hypothetical protein